VNTDELELKQNLRWGWISAFAGAGILFAALNFQYSFGVFFKPISNYFGLSRAVVSGVVSVRSIVSGVISPLAGSLSDKYGPKGVVLVGIILAGIGYLLSSRIGNVWQLYIFISFIGLGQGAILTPLLSTISGWFKEKAALANGILMSGFGMGQIVVPPVATYLLLNYSWKICFIILGIVAIILGTLAWSFVRSAPQEIILPSSQLDSERVDTKTNHIKAVFTVREAMGTSVLWKLLFIQIVNAITFQMMVVHVVAAATDKGISLEAAALILTISGITNTVGRLTISGLASRVGNKAALASSLLIQAPMLFLLATANNSGNFYLAAAVHGIAYGGVAPIIPTLAGSMFGRKSAGGIIGLTNLAYTLGIAIGPLMAGFIFDFTGNYFVAISLAGSMMTISFVLSLLLKPPQQRSIVV